MRYDNLIKNIKSSQIILNDNNEFPYKLDYLNERESFIIRNNEKEIEENVINSYLIEEDLVKIKTENNEIFEVNLSSFSKILSKKEVNSKTFFISSFQSR